MSSTARMADHQQTAGSAPVGQQQAQPVPASSSTSSTTTTPSVPIPGSQQQKPQPHAAAGASPTQPVPIASSSSPMAPAGVLGTAQVGTPPMGGLPAYRRQAGAGLARPQGPAQFASPMGGPVYYYPAHPYGYGYYDPSVAAAAAVAGQRVPAPQTPVALPAATSSTPSPSAPRPIPQREVKRMAFVDPKTGKQVALGSASPAPAGPAASGSSGPAPVADAGTASSQGESKGTEPPTEHIAPATATPSAEVVAPRELEKKVYSSDEMQAVSSSLTEWESLESLKQADRTVPARYHEIVCEIAKTTFYARFSTYSIETFKRIRDTGATPKRLNEIINVIKISAVSKENTKTKRVPDSRAGVGGGGYGAGAKGGSRGPNVGPAGLQRTPSSKALASPSGKGQGPRDHRDRDRDRHGGAGKKKGGPRGPHMNVELPNRKDESQRYVPKKEETDFLEKTTRSIQSVLNKLTDLNYDRLKDKLKEAVQAAVDLIVSEPDGKPPAKLVFGRLIELIFSKAVWEPTFSGMYADLCKYLNEIKWANMDSVSFDADFRRMMVESCQKEFEKEVDFSELEKLEGEERHEKDSLLRKRMTGNVKFIGELLKRSLISTKVSTRILRALLYPVGVSEPRPEQIEQACKFFTTAGPVMEAAEDSRPVVPAAVRRFQELSLREDLYPSRLRFMMKDVIELQANKWQNPALKSSSSLQDLEKAGSKQLGGGKRLGPKPGDRRPGPPTPSGRDSGSLSRISSSDRVDDHQKPQVPAPGSAASAPSTVAAAAPSPAPVNVDKQILNDIREYLSSGDEKEFSLCIKSLKQADQPKALSVMLSKMFEAKVNDQKLLINALIALLDQGIVREQAVQSALQSSIINAIQCELDIDVPQLWVLLGRLFSRLVLEVEKFTLTSLAGCLTLVVQMACSDDLSDGISKVVSIMNFFLKEVSSTPELSAAYTQQALSEGTSLLRVFPVGAEGFRTFYLRNPDEIVQIEPSLALVCHLHDPHNFALPDQITDVLQETPGQLAEMVADALTHVCGMQEDGSFEDELQRRLEMSFGEQSMLRAALSDTEDSGASRAMETVLNVFALDSSYENACTFFRCLYKKSIWAESQIMELNDCSSFVLLKDFVAWLKTAKEKAYE